MLTMRKSGLFRGWPNPAGESRLRLLFDTHVAMWAVAASDRLLQSTRALIEDPNSNVYVPMCSLWEMDQVNARSPHIRANVRG
jgi:PIN domain nuclease of toxin-antitoxin system